MQRKILTLVTVVSLVCTLAAVLVIARLTPLKTVEPFVIQVDQKSGITQTVDPLTARELTSNEAVNNFYIVQYIRSREGYNPADLIRSYDTVRIMSENKDVYPEFITEADPNNPNSNAARLGNTGTRTVKFKSITYLTPTTVQARILVEEKSDGAGYRQEHKIVTIEFQYIKLALTNEERYINPLGFRVTSYRVVEEVLQR